MKDIKQLKRHLELTNNDIADLFNYKNGHSFAHSTRRQCVEDGMVKLSDLIEARMNEFSEDFVCWIIKNYTILRAGGEKDVITKSTIDELRKTYLEESKI